MLLLPLRGKAVAQRHYARARSVGGPHYKPKRAVPTTRKKPSSITNLVYWLYVRLPTFWQTECQNGRDEAFSRANAPPESAKTLHFHSVATSKHLIIFVGRPKDEWLRRP